MHRRQFDLNACHLHCVACSLSEVNRHEFYVSRSLFLCCHTFLPLSSIPTIPGHQKTSLNAFPNEILTEIFRFYSPIVAVRADEPQVEPIARHIKGWVLLSHVCKDWRATTLDFALAWSQLSLTANAEWIEELLARTKTIDLDMLIKAQDSPALKQVASTVIRREIHRIRSLSFDRCGWATDPDICSALAAAPRLEVLRITGSTLEASPEEIHQYCRNFDTSLLTYLHGYSRNKAIAGPRRIEILGNCTSGIVPVLFCTVGSALQHIVFSGEWFVVLLHIYILFVNRLLFHGPYKSLDVNICHRREFIPLGNSLVKAFPMPGLRRLRLRGRTQQCARLLDLLDLTELSELTVEATFLGRIEVQDAFATAFSSKLATLGPTAVHRVDLRSGDDRSVWLQGFDANGDHKLTLVLLTTEQYDEEDVLAALLERCQTSFCNVRTLFCNDLDLSDSSWMAVFSAFPNVEDLTLELATSDVLTALWCAIRSGGSDAGDPEDEAQEQADIGEGLALPRLLSLTLHNLEDKEADIDSWDEESFNILFDVEQYLPSRARLNNPITSLRLVNCTESGYPSYNLEALENLVATIAWV